MTPQEKIALARLRFASAPLAIFYTVSGPIEFLMYFHRWLVPWLLALAIVEYRPFQSMLIGISFFAIPYFLGMGAGAIVVRDTVIPDGKTWIGILVRKLS